MSMIGKTLGHYSVSALLGKGGMGEVYKAKDQKLGRDVAIKVLPEEFAKDTDRVARFQREAKLLASLNHPNIAAIHGLEESDGTHFLVLELIEGDTLADRLKRGAIPVEESLKLALQIAEALEAAHENGVIHRDLKPANIKVTPDRKIKVLDFGLAKAFAGDSEDMNLSNSPTLSVAATQKGIILGTAAYMSPEQASGEATDRRADVWAFGVVLYEMVTGRPLFEGNSVSQTLARVLERQPDFSTLPPNLHQRIRLLMERCLEKEPRNRCSSIGDARVDIEKALADTGNARVQPVTAAVPRSRFRLGTLYLSWSVAAFLLVVAVVALWSPWRKVNPISLVRFTEELAADISFVTDPGPAVALSPDGNILVLVAQSSGAKPQLYMRRLDQLQIVPMQGTDDASCPFFSPDGQWIAFFAGDKLKKVSITGGAAITLCDAPVGRGGTWADDGTIAFASAATPNLMRVSFSGGKPEPLTMLGEDERTHRWPQILPGSKALLYTSHTSTVDFDNGNLVVQALPDGERKIIQRGGYYGRYLSSGDLVYIHEGTLFAAPFDLDRLEMTGQPVPVLEGVRTLTRSGGAQFAVSDNGTFVYLPGESTGGLGTQNILVWLDRKGKEEPIVATANEYFEPKISPDGTKVALTIGALPRSDIWIWDLIRETATRLTFNENSHSPLWTLDGQRIAFTSYSDDGPGIYWKAADGTGNDELLSSMPGQTSIPFSWSSDGKTLAVLEYSETSDLNIAFLSMEGDHARTPILQEEYREYQPQISPDGKWMAYASDESGEAEIYVRPFPDVDKGRWQVSTSGGRAPLWSPDDRELFYIKHDGTVEAAMAVSVVTEPTFKAGKPEILFQRPAMFGGILLNLRFWDIRRDGKRFLMMKRPEAVEDKSSPEIPRKITIILNWFEELKERVPTN